MDKKPICDRLDSIIETNRETQRWLKILALERVKDSVKEAMGDHEPNRELYDSLDGKTPISDIIGEIDMSERSAYRRLDDWQKIGIVWKEARGRYNKLASLDSLGLSSRSRNE